jgi:hypothetical protein
MSNEPSVLYPTEEGFIELATDAELLHIAPQDPSDYTLSETSYFGFNVPEADIDCEIYAWFHPNLGVATGGIMIFQGYKTMAGQAEYLDYRNFLPMPQGDIDDVHYPTGVHVRVIDPLKLIKIDFASPDGQTTVDLTCRAIMPPAGRTDGKHFVQAMKCDGELVLRGERHTIDSYFTRDRSFLLPRSEEPHPVLPLSWVAAVFGDDLAFHAVGADSDEVAASALRWGYVWRDGRVRAVTAMRKKTLRAGNGIWPTGVEMELVDSAGETYVLRGEGRAMLPMPFWPNMITNLTLTRWEYDGRVGYGDYQDVQFGHSLRSVPSTTTL